MLPTYQLTCIPLDSSPAEGSPSSFSAYVVANLQFPSGVATASTVAGAVAAHPFLGRAANNPIRGFALDYAGWLAAGRTINPSTAIPLTLTYLGERPLTSLRDTLAAYLFRSTDITVAAIIHDPSFDGLSENDFVNTVEAHDDFSSARLNFHMYAA
jgi:hypothetical protein